MFDFGFWELAIVMVIVLLVVGPERLPTLAGQLGKWVGKVKRVMESVRSDIESQIKAAELKDILEKQQSEIGELKEMLKDTKKEIEEESDRSLIEAVEKHIQSTKDSRTDQQELTFNSKTEKQDAD